MSTSDLLSKLSEGQTKTLSGSQYVLALYARASILNYPVVILRNVNTKVPLFIEQIKWSCGNSPLLEFYAVTNISTPSAAALSSIRYFNKRLITGNVSTEFFGLTGEITPAQYNALIYGEDIYTVQPLPGIVHDGTLDFSQSNILLQADPITNASQSIAVVAVNAQAQMWIDFDITQVNALTNNVS